MAKKRVEKKDEIPERYKERVAAKYGIVSAPNLKLTDFYTKIVRTYAGKCAEASVSIEDYIKKRPLDSRVYMRLSTKLSGLISFGNIVKTHLSKDNSLGDYQKNGLFMILDGSLDKMYKTKKSLESEFS